MKGYVSVSKLGTIMFLYQLKINELKLTSDAVSARMALYSLACFEVAEAMRQGKQISNYTVADLMEMSAGIIEMTSTQLVNTYDTITNFRKLLKLCLDKDD